MLYYPGSNSTSVPIDEPGKLVSDGLLPSITILNCEGRIGFCSHVAGSVWQSTFLITVSVSVPISGGGVGGVGVDDDNILCSLSLLFIHLKRNSLSKPIFVHHCQSLHLLFCAWAAKSNKDSGNSSIFISFPLRLMLSQSILSSRLLLDWLCTSVIKDGDDNNEDGRWWW